MSWNKPFAKCFRSGGNVWSDRVEEERWLLTYFCLPHPTAIIPSFPPNDLQRILYIPTLQFFVVSPAEKPMSQVFAKFVRVY